MASNLLPLLLAGGAVAVISSKKKKKKSTSADVSGLPPLVAPPTKAKTASSSTWRKRQQALMDTGYNIGPSGADGVAGKDTRNAVMEFQKDARILIDGKWGAQTAAAMAQALKMAAQGLGRAAYATIGSMISQFMDTLSKFSKGKESQDSGLSESENETLKEQLFTLSQIHQNSNLDPDKHSLEYVLMEFQNIFGLEPTGTATLETRVKLNEVISGG